MKRIRIDRRGTRRESPWLEDLPARGRAARPPGLASPGLAGVLDERRQLLPEGLGVLGGQIDLILRPAEGEVDGLVGRAATEVVFQRDDYSLCHFNLHNGAGVLAPYLPGVTGHSGNAASHTQHLRRVIIVRGLRYPGSQDHQLTGLSHSVIRVHNLRHVHGLIGAPRAAAPVP